MKKILGVGIMGIFLFILLLSVLATYIKTGTTDTFTFKSLLEIFSNSPMVDVSWSNVDLTIYADWGVFNFLKSFLNWFAQIFEFLVTIVGMLWQGLNYMFYFVRTLFV